MHIDEQDPALPRSTEANDRLHALVPGGAHTYAKGDDQYPTGFAPVISHGRGAHVWDVDGREYVEYGSGLRAVVLGHAHPRVVNAVHAEIERGANFVRPCIVELKCGGALPRGGTDGGDGEVRQERLGRHDGGGQARPRGHRPRPLVAICRDHPFFSTDDWFIGTTPMAAGMPDAIRELTVTFRTATSTPSSALFDRHAGQIACLILEPATQRRSARRATFRHCANLATATARCSCSTR